MKTLRREDCDRGNASGVVARCKMDSHADSCGAGTNFHLDKYAGKNCDITSYSTDYEPIKLVPIFINASTAYMIETSHR